MRERPHDLLAADGAALYSPSDRRLDAAVALNGLHFLIAHLEVHVIRESIFVGALVVCCGLLAGCESAPTTEVSPVSGTVLLDGKPVEGVSITLVPEGNTTGNGGYGTTDASGQFTLKAGPELDGVPPGNYKVLFTKLALPDGSPIPPDAMAADVGATNHLPPRYNNPEMTTIKLTVPPPSEEATKFELTSSGR